MSKLESARRRAATLAKKARESSDAFIEKGAMGAAAYGLGKMEAGGTFFGLDVPALMNFPKAVTVGAIGLIGSRFASGKMAAALEGVGDAGLSVALYNFGRGEGVTGASPQELAELEAALDQAMALEQAQTAAEG